MPFLIILKKNYFTDTYPNTIPKIQVNINSKTNQSISAEIKVYAEQFEGSPMLYSIITKAEELSKNYSSNEQKESDNLKMFKEERSQDSEKDTATNAKKSTIPKASTCKFFLKGQCRFGEKCLNLHPGANKTKSQPIQPSSPTKQEKSNSEKINLEKTNQALHQKKSHATLTGDSSSSQAQNKTNSSDSDGQLQKKSSMKTATDVIHRILWDDALPTGDFIIGYLDRFIGVIEKPFTAFSWEDIASVDLNVLAVPKHRIQYFKYRDIVVWDKNKRMDKVFCSTGDSQNIIEIIEKENAKKAAKMPTDGPQEVIEGKYDRKNNNKSNNNNNNKSSEKNRPNHFLCIRITDDAIKKHIKEVSVFTCIHCSIAKSEILDDNEKHLLFCSRILDVNYLSLFTIFLEMSGVRKCLMLAILLICFFGTLSMFFF